MRCWPPERHDARGATARRRRSARRASATFRDPAARELLVRVEACGICPTDVRKYAIGTRDGYPLNPGHEWVGAVAEVGSGVTGWSTGQRVCGDTYAGYAEYALLSVEPGAWSNGALAIPADLDACAPRSWSRSPTASTRCATRRAAGEGSRVCVVGAGQMGLQIVAVAADAGAKVTVVEPQAERRELARASSAPRDAVGAEALAEAADGCDAVILTIGAA